MYELSANAVWGMDGTSEISYAAYTRIKEWSYSDKGWFCHQLCVPEYPEVTETVDGSRPFRIKPMTEELREMSWKCVKGLAYQGNNLLCSNWDEEHTGISIPYQWTAGKLKALGKGRQRCYKGYSG